MAVRKAAREAVAHAKPIIERHSRLFRQDLWRLGVYASVAMVLMQLGSAVGPMLWMWWTGNGASRSRQQVPIATVEFRLAEAQRLLDMLLTEHNSFVACCDSVILRAVQLSLPEEAQHRVLASTQGAIYRAQQCGGEVAVVHIWAQDSVHGQARHLPPLKVPSPGKEQHMLLLRGDSNADGSPRLSLGAVDFAGPEAHLVTQNLGWHKDLSWLNGAGRVWVGTAGWVYKAGKQVACSCHIFYIGRQLAKFQEF